MKMNPDKCNLLILDTKAEQVCAQIGKRKILEIRAVKVLGVTIDNNLKFDEHLSLKNVKNVAVKIEKKMCPLRMTVLFLYR